MRTIIYIPPLPRTSGGIAVLYQLATRLRELGKDCFFVSSGNTAEKVPGLAEQKEKGGRQLEWSVDGSFLSPEDIYIVPEGWPNALAPGLAAGCHCIVYVQNWAFLHSGLPHGVRWQQLPVKFIAVSQPVSWFLQEIAHLQVEGVVRPSLDGKLFAPSGKSGKTLRIAWMPRKNKALAEQIKTVTEVALGGKNHPPLEWVEIHRMSQEAVAEELGKSHIFLCTGFPEGLALPPLEAMASGCLVVGFSGFGGWDYMRDARCEGQPRLSPTEFSLREVPWGGNGYFAMDGDILGAALALKEAILTTEESASCRNGIIAAARQTAQAYSSDAQMNEIASLWNRLES